MAISRLKHREIGFRRALGGARPPSSGQRPPRKSGEPWWWLKWQGLSRSALTSRRCLRAGREAGCHGKVSETGICHGLTCGRSPKPGSASWSDPPMTPYPVPETSTSGSAQNNSAPFAVPTMQASSTSCRAARQHCPKAAIGGDTIWCWGS